MSVGKVTVPVASVSSGQALSDASSHVSADRAPFRSWVPGMEQRNLLTSRDYAFIQRHVRVGSIGLSVTRRPPAVTSGILHGDNRVLSFPMGTARPQRIIGRRPQHSYFWIAGDGAEFDIVERDAWLTANIVFADDGESLDQFRVGRALSVFEVHEEALRPLRNLLASVVQESETE